MGRNIKFIVSTFMTALLLSVANRIVFIIYYNELSADFTATELFRCFVHGLGLDCSIAGYITAIPLIMTMAAIWLPAKWKSPRIWDRILTWYFGIMTFIAAVIETADIGMFGDWLSRINSQIFIYTPKEMLASVSVSDGIAAVAYVAVTVTAGVLLFRAGMKRWLLPQLEETAAPTSGKAVQSVVMTLLCGLVFLFIRGGVTTATANVSMAFFSDNMLLNQIAVNPVFSFIESAVESTEKELNDYDYHTSEEAERLFRESLGGNVPDNEANDSTWLRTNRPNIVMVIMEGMGRTMTDAYEDTAAVAPEINRLKHEGIWFDRLYASSFRTDRGNVAMLSGFPGQPNMSIMKQSGKASKLPGVAQALKDEGYRTRFIYGGDAGFTNTRAYVYSSGFEELTDDSSLDLTGHVSKWGYADDVILEYSAGQILECIRKEDGPTFDVILTLSSHEPFEVPYKRLNDPMLNSFAFTDAQIGRFVDTLSATDEWKDMLLILIPDHSTAHPVSIGNNTPERHHIPMIWLGGAIKGPMIIDEYMAQTDLAATLLSQLDIPHDKFIFSRDMTSPHASHFGYWTYNNGFGMIDENGVTIYDCETESVIRNEGDPDSLRLEYGKAILQKTFIEIRGM